MGRTLDGAVVRDPGLEPSWWGNALTEPATYLLTLGSECHEKLRSRIYFRHSFTPEVPKVVLKATFRTVRFKLRLFTNETLFPIGAQPKAIVLDSLVLRIGMVLMAIIRPVMRL